MEINNGKSCPISNLTECVLTKCPGSSQMYGRVQINIYRATSYMYLYMIERFKSWAFR